MLRTNVFPNLSRISLSYNRLSSIPQIFQKDAMSQNFSLYKKLNLSLTNNRIRNINNLKQFGFIEVLDLSNNFISSWKDIDVFHSERHGVNTLRLANNKLSIMTDKMLQSLVSVHSVDLTGNKFRNGEACNKLFSWMEKYPNKIRFSLGRKNRTKKICSPSANLDSIRANLENHTLQSIIYSCLVLFFVSFISVIIILGIKYKFQLLYVWHLLKLRRTTRDLQVFQTNELKTRYKFDAFVAYNFKDRNWVHDHLVKTLESDQEKYSFCLHERDFRLGAYIMDNIANNMKNCRRVIIVLSSNFLKSNVS
jgi:hypothetical protein